MINKQRVRRIKNLIYAFIILVLFLPLILMSILSFHMIGLAQKMDIKLDELNAAVSKQTPPPSSSGGGYVIEPEGQAVKGESPKPQQMEGINPGNSSDQVPAASGDKPETTGTTPSETTSEKAADGIIDLNGGNLPLIGNASGIDGVHSGILDSVGDSKTGSTAGTSGEGYAGNPQTGSDSILSYLQNEKNPLTGR